MRNLEYDERMATGTRGHWAAQELLAAATINGHQAIGWPEAGRISAGSLADLVTIDLSSPRLAGAAGDHVVELAAFSACAADVTHVVSSGRAIVADGRHLTVGDVGAALRSAIAAVVMP